MNRWIVLLAVWAASAALGRVEQAFAALPPIEECELALFDGAGPGDSALALGLRVPGHGWVELELERFPIASPRVRVVVGRVGEPDRPVAFDWSAIRAYRGKARGLPASRALLVVSPHGTTGWITLDSIGPRHWISSRVGGQSLPGTRVLVFPHDGSVPNPAPEPCGVDTASRPPADPSGSVAPVSGDSATRLGLRRIELAVETDYEYYVLFNDVQAAADYAARVYAAVSDIYMEEVNTRVDLVFVRIWDTPDDLFNGSDPLGSFRSYWNANMRHVQRDVAQFFSGRRNLPWGGVAYLNGLCNNASYSVVGYAQGAFPEPVRPGVHMFDIGVTAHELGHNCNALHTPDYGIDRCNETSTPARRGGIMSYCSQTVSGGKAVQDLRFETPVRADMIPYITTRACIITDCNMNGISDADDIATGFSPDTNGNGIPDECEDCNGNGVLDPDDIAVGTSLDLNGNGVPDECEPDCNGNGVPDDLDISRGTSTDLHYNAVPDECEPDCNADGISDFTQIMADMTLDKDRDTVPDACQDCDGDGVPDLVELDGAHHAWIVAQDGLLSETHPVTGVVTRRATGGSLASPSDVIVTPDRRVLVSSSGDSRIVEFWHNGHYVRDLVPAGSGGLATPRAMLLRSDGRLLVASAGNHSVREYDGSTGAFLRVLVPGGSGGLSMPWGLALGPAGGLYVTSADNRVLEYDAQTGAFRRVVVTSGLGNLNSPRGIAFHPFSGNLLVCSYSNDSVLEYNPATGAFVRRFNNGGTSTVLNLDGPVCIRFRPDGVYVSMNIQPADSHMTTARVFIFDYTLGYLMRPYIVGHDTGIFGPTGFDFAPGDHADCNRNARPDECDILQRLSRDLNGNGRPDECDPCPVDVNNDGGVDFNDFLAFLNLYNDQSPRADLNLDGLVDFNDLLEFLTLYNAGC